MQRSGATNLDGKRSLVVGITNEAGSATAAKLHLAVVSTLAAFLVDDGPPHYRYHQLRGHLIV